MKQILLLSLFCCTLMLTNCSDPVIGCTNPAAENYNPDADEDSGDCQFRGCTDPNAVNYDPMANVDSGDCQYNGCTDPNAANYDPMATNDSGDCLYPGCTDEDADNYDAMFNEDDGSCTYFERFEGEYEGEFECMGTFAGLLDLATASVVRKPGEENMDEITVLVSNPATEINLLLTGTITKDEAIIDTYIENFEYTIEIDEFVIEGPFEVFVTGTLTRNEDGSLEGPITIRIDKASIAASITDTCTYQADKK